MSTIKRSSPSAGKSSPNPGGAGPPAKKEGLASGMTVRAVALGLVLSASMAWWVVHSAFEAHSSYLSITHMPMAALFPFMLVVFVINGLLKRFAPTRIFTAPELIIIFFIVFTASAIPGWAFTTYWVAVPSIPHYYANSENRYVELFFEYLPTWLIVPDERRAVHWFYEGLPSSGVIPWRDWIIPMSWWGTFFLALFFASASLMVILRKQWIERERLTLPAGPRAPAARGRRRERFRAAPDRPVQDILVRFFHPPLRHPVEYRLVLGRRATHQTGRGLPHPDHPGRILSGDSVQG